MWFETFFIYDMYEISSLKRDINDISVCQEGYTRSLSIKGDVWDILLIKRDAWYPFI